MRLFTSFVLMLCLSACTAATWYKPSLHPHYTALSQDITTVVTGNWNLTIQASTTGTSGITVFYPNKKAVRFNDIISTSQLDLHLLQAHKGAYALLELDANHAMIMNASSGTIRVFETININQINSDSASVVLFGPRNHTKVHAHSGEVRIKHDPSSKALIDITSKHAHIDVMLGDAATSILDIRTPKENEAHISFGPGIQLSKSSDQHDGLRWHVHGSEPTITLSTETGRITIKRAGIIL